MPALRTGVLNINITDILVYYACSQGRSNIHVDVRYWTSRASVSGAGVRAHRSNSTSEDARCATPPADSPSALEQPDSTRAAVADTGSLQG